MARRLAKEEGILAAFLPAPTSGRRFNTRSAPENKGKLIVTFAPSTGERYLSTALAAEARAEVTKELIILRDEDRSPFSGQGSQTVGMGRDLCEKYEVCGTSLPTPTKYWVAISKRFVLKVPLTCSPRRTNAQPGIFLTSLVCLEALKCQAPDLAFDATAGLSLGEFTALAAADAVSFDDGLRMVQMRGRFMQEACDATNGGMASILNMDDAALAEVCREADVDIANINCPGQVVISGDKEKNCEGHRACEGKGR